jgi:hypothetical protein
MDELKKDLRILSEATRQVDMLFLKNSSDSYHYLKNLRKLVDMFNKKYKNISTAIDKGSLKIDLKVFIHAKSISEIFNDLEFDTNRPESEPEPMLILKKDPKRDLIELIYRNGALMDTHSPEFLALSRYAEIIDDLNLNESDLCFNIDESGGLLYKDKKIVRDDDED